MGRLLNVEHKLRVLDDVDPVAKWQTAKPQNQNGLENFITCLVEPFTNFHIERTTPYLLVFQMCNTSGSLTFMLSACVSKKSKKYLTATGTLQCVVPQMDLNRFSTNECTATFKEAEGMEHFKNSQLAVANPVANCHLKGRLLHLTLIARCV